MGDPRAIFFCLSHVLAYQDARATTPSVDGASDMVVCVLQVLACLSPSFRPLLGCGGRYHAAPGMARFPYTEHPKCCQQGVDFQRNVM